MKIFDIFKRKFFIKAFIYLDVDGAAVSYGRITSRIKWLTDWAPVKGVSLKRCADEEIDRLAKIYPEYAGCIYIF